LRDLNEMDVAEARHWIEAGAIYLAQLKSGRRNE
jgi:hypothetical protein